MAKYQYTIVIEQDEDGVYISSCPALQACHSYGDTYEEALRNIREVIQLHIEARQSIGKPISINHV